MEVAGGRSVGTPALTAVTDERLIDDALAVVEDARKRAPREFVVALAVLLGAIALALLVAALVTSGILQDLLLNLAAEVVGACLTVVLIDGLWKRMEAGASESMTGLTRRLEERRTATLSDAERQAWPEFVAGYDELARHGSPIARMRSVRDYRHRLQELERRGNRTLREFDPDVAIRSETA